jgi:acyl-CoA reductase-like NAD-dependent aldehyde dehydrogenase
LREKSGELMSNPAQKISVARSGGLELADTELLQTQAFIDGQWVDADSGATLDVVNPATGELLARVSCCGTVETRRAIKESGQGREGSKYGLEDYLEIKYLCVGGLDP